MRNLLLLFVLIAPVVTLHAQPKGRLPPNYINPAQLNLAEGQAVMEKFRNAHPAGDYSFHFELRDTPAQGPNQFFRGQLWGSWQAAGPVTRIALFKEAERVEFLVQNGPAPKMWRILADKEATPVALTQTDYTHPLMGSMQFTPFELQMPFIYWKDFVYEGSERVKGRPAYTFILYPPEGALLPTNLAAVRVTVDADFNALLRAETLDGSGKPMKSFRILSFKKAGETWIVKTIDLIDERTRAKTRFTVIAAAVAQEFGKELFTVGTPLPSDTPARDAFIYFD
ncbi:MAG: outer membrane lipoprotein-sorting protein [Verrucomicrobiota bacterium]|nr:outer membrane lipoprotein-sorting protein [Verrucomicrobiota bacterium]